jgi:hypothetical protein
MIRSRLVLLALLALAIACLLPASAPAAGCSVRGKERKLGATYVTKISVSHVSCATAYKVIKSYHRCRHRHGAAGHCRRTSGYRCSEKRTAAIKTQYDARATCRSGSRRITHNYTQFT